MINIPAVLSCDARGGCKNTCNINLELKHGGEFNAIGCFEVESVPGSVQVFVVRIPDDWTSDYGLHYCPEHKDPWGR